MVPDVHKGTMKHKHHVQRYEFATEYVRDKSVLDVACGSGYGSLMLANAGAKFVTGMDLSEEALVYANSNYADGKVKFERRDAQVDLGNETYDVVVSFETLEHLKQSHTFLQNVHRALKNGGIFIVSSPNRDIFSPGLERPSNPHHEFELTKPEFIEMLENTGFEINEFWGQLFPAGPLRGFRKFLRRVTKVLRKTGLISREDMPRFKRDRGDAPIFVIICRPIK